MVILIQSVAFFISLQSITPLACSFLGSCWILISLANDMETELSLLTVGSTSNRSHQKNLERFCSIVRFQSDAKQLSGKFQMHITRAHVKINVIILIFRLSIEINGIVKFFVLAQFLWFVAILCIPLVILHHELVEY